MSLRGFQTKWVKCTISILQVDTEDRFVEKALELANDESRWVGKPEWYSRRPVLLEPLDNVRRGHRPDVLKPPNAHVQETGPPTQSSS